TAGWPVTPARRRSWPGRRTRRRSCRHPGPGCWAAWTSLPWRASSERAPRCARGDWPRARRAGPQPRPLATVRSAPKRPPAPSLSSEPQCRSPRASKTPVSGRAGAAGAGSSGPQTRWPLRFSWRARAAALPPRSRGHVRSSGRVALLLQNPGDYLIHDRVAHEAGPAALGMVGLGAPEFADRHPRDLSGGEKQRLALAIVLDDGDGDGDGDQSGGERATVVCLDEPTRGMDRARKQQLARTL